MKKLISNKAFKNGFWAGILMFLAIHILNFIMLLNVKPPPSNLKINIGTIYYFGFPFPIFEWNHYSAVEREFYILGLVANTLVTLIFSFVLGLIFKLVRSKIAPLKLK